MNLRRSWSILGLGVVLSLLVAPSASAHAAYESSDPSNGATVSSPPSRITAQFTEPLVSGSKLEVYDPCGAQVDGGDSFVAGDQLTISMSADKQGAYRIRFSVVSAVDGHPTNGEFGFTSTGGAPCEQPEEEDPAGEEPVDASGGSGGASNGAGSSSTSTTSTEGPASSGSNAAGGAGLSADRGGTGSQDRSVEAAGGDRDVKTPAERLAAPKARVANIQGSPVAAGSGPAGAFEGMPMGALAVGLLLAASTGAAGGKIYAGIMGWTSAPRSQRRAH